MSLDSKGMTPFTGITTSCSLGYHFVRPVELIGKGVKTEKEENYLRWNSLLSGMINKDF